MAAQPAPPSPPLCRRTPDGRDVVQRTDGGLKLIIELEKTAAVDSLLSHSTDCLALSVAPSPPHSTKLHVEKRRRRRKKKKPTNEARRDGRTTCK